MSTKTIGFPSNPSLDQEHQGWVWDGEKWIKEGSESGAGMVISETEPTDKVEGMQWLNPTTGLVLFWDDSKWLQMPTTGAAGKDGVDGVDGLWEANGDDIYYDKGSVGIGTDSIDIYSQLHVANGIAGIMIEGSGAGSFAQLNFKTPDHAWNIGMRPEYGESLVVRNGLNGLVPMFIKKDGDVTLAHNTSLWGKRASGDLALKLIGYDPGTDDVELITSAKWTIKNGARDSLLSVDANGRVDIPGSLYVNGAPKIGTVDMIKAFSKLRDAIKDEDTVESLKESITNCIGGLIEEWESMQSPATQEIER